MQSKGYTPKESDDMIDKVLQYNDLGLEFDRHSFRVGLVMLILSILGTILMTWFIIKMNSLGMDNGFFYFFIICDLFLFCCIFCPSELWIKKS